MKSTDACIKDAFQNKSFFVNTGLYMHLHHNNQSSRSKSYHFTPLRFIFYLFIFNCVNTFQKSESVKLIIPRR